MNVDATLESGAQLAEGSQPGVSAPDHPAVVTEPIIALDASKGEVVLAGNRPHKVAGSESNDPNC
ncbi:hypothetical protein E5CHR_01576 [Variovorax sp. PBL-E5]|nr:hypothetical protein E5CHR_01576 [Variovorax sp. PBL-E5]